MEIRPLQAGDRSWLEAFFVTRWGAAEMIVRGEVFYPHTLPGFVALEAGTVVGLATYRLAGDACELTSIDSLQEGCGIGTRLLTAVVAAARTAGCLRVILVTTNDNLNALRFYQKRGFVLTAVHPNAVTQARERKPSIPLIGMHGIPIRDELELEYALPT